MCTISKKLICLFMLLTISSVSWAFPSVQKINDSVVDSEALTMNGGPYGNEINGLSFQQDAVISHKGYQYVGYYNSARHVCLSRRQLPNGLWQRIEFADYYFASDDAHNTISVGICPNDGTIHIAFDHHVHPLHYRVSQVGVANNPGDVTWDASLFSPIRDYLETGKNVTSLTYPAFFKTPSGDMQMVYRYASSGNGDWILVDYSGTTSKWGNTRKFISHSGTFTDEYNTSTSRCAYPNPYMYGPNGNLHVTWVWREQTQGANHDIMYSCSPDGGTTWLNDKNSDLRLIVNDATAPQTLLRMKKTSADPNVIGMATGDSQTEKLIRVDSPGVTVVNIPRKYGIMNTQAQAVDPQGRIHVAGWHCSDDSYDYAKKQGYDPHLYTWGHPYARRYHHYWRDLNGLWQHHEMKWVAGNRPKLFIKPNGDAFLIYNASRNPENMSSGGLHFSDGDLVIAAATSQSRWTDWKIIHTEPGLFYNEMLADPVRFEQDQILSIMVQESSTVSRQPTKLRILDFSLSK